MYLPHIFMCLADSLFFLCLKLLKELVFSYLRRHCGGMVEQSMVNKKQIIGGQKECVQRLAVQYLT